MHIVFLGTPEFAVPTLNAFITHQDLNVVAVITQPDRKSGRGQKLHPPPVKALAQAHHIPVFQPEKLSKATDVVEHIKSLAPDLMVTVAFGQIFKPEFLAIPKMGMINLHFSLLPAYRGAAPLNWAIINGDTVSGITTMFTEAGLDTGPILLKQEIAIDPNINAEELGKQMADKGADLVLKTIEQLKGGNLVAVPQDDNKATYAPLLSKAISTINWAKPASTIHNFIRGLVPWPIAVTTFHDQSLKIRCAQLPSMAQTKELTAISTTGQLGAIVVSNKRVFVACLDNTWLELKEVQPPNKSKLTAYDWANGMRIQNGDRFLA